eukprot:jgi/Mesen1/4940/ME000247S04220
MELQWVWLAAIACLLFLLRLFWSWRSHPLSYESGRRSNFKPHRKDASHYASYGVRTIEAFVKNSRGVELFTKQWLPLNGNLRGLVFYCHGYGDTCNYFFDSVAVELATAQYAVVAVDYEGHGQSQGLHGYIPRFETIIDDVMEYTQSIRERAEYRGLPCFLFGESMGGAVALKVHRRQPQAWDGAILLAPMCKISEDVYPPAVVVLVLKMLAKMFPKWQLVPTKDICELTFRVPEKRQLGYDNPLAYKGKPRLGTAVQLLHTTDEIAAKLHEVNIPLLILHGGADLVTDPSISKALHECAISQDKELKIYEGSWHGLIAGEPDEVAQVVLQDIVNWLDARSIAPGGDGQFPKERKLAGHLLQGGYGDDSDESSTVTA